MKQLTVAFTVGFLLFVTSPPVWAQGTFPLEYKIVKTFSYDDSLVSMASQYFSRSPGIPAGLKGIPKEARGELTYYMAGLGSRQIAVAMDAADPPNLFVDRNGNGDLSDERPVKRTKALMSWGAEGSLYGPVSLAAGKDGATARMLLARRDDDLMMACPAGYLTGQVKLGGKTFKISLVDANYDGRYEPVTDITAAAGGIRGAGDTLGIDLNGDGKFDYDPYAGCEIQPLTPMTHVADAYYKIKMADDGSSIEVVKVEPKMGTLTVKGGVELLVLGDSGLHHLKGSKSSWLLPEGRYACQSIGLTAADEKKAKWVLRTAGRNGELQDFQIQADRTKSVELGAPLTARADVQKQTTGWIFKGTEVSVGFVLMGKAGEEYLPGAMKDGEQVPAPRITIYDADGKVLATGSFAYG